MNVQGGTVAGVPVNGVAVPVIFPTAYLSTVAVAVTPNLTGSPLNQVLGCEAINVSLTGFSIWVTGGDPVSTIGVGWIASGT